jgi:hypothetical protein
MNPRWPEQRSSTETIKSTARVHEALKWITADLVHPENAATWAALSDIEPERSQIELFDCVWWIYFRRLEPVPWPPRTSADSFGG